MKKKQKWGKFLLAEGFIVVKGREVPMRILVSFPYQWHLTHSGEHTRRYWAARRKKAGRNK